MQKCWCGGQVGPRTPGDINGQGCLDHISHDWEIARWCDNCEDSDPGALHTYDDLCLQRKGGTDGI